MKLTSKTPLILPLLLLAAGYGSTASAEEEQRHPYDIAKDRCAIEISQLKNAAGDNADKLFLDFIVADRAAKTVTVFGCATSIGAEEPAEFFFAPANSGKDYESLAITWARPSDVQKALEFIGLKPGHPVNYEKNLQWARGPRVVLNFEREGKSVRAESLVLNSDTKQTLPPDGLIFGGSFSVKNEQGKSQFAADETDAKPIAPIYNDPASVLDIPRQASQASVYGFQRPSAAYTYKQGDVLHLILTPATGDAAAEERDLHVNASVKDEKVHYRLAESDKLITDAEDLPHLVAAVADRVNGKDDFFTTVSVDPDLPVTDIRKLYAVLMATEKDRGIKLDPPAEGNLFHRAFFPEEEWRQREGRLGEPWELFLERTDDKLTARLERLVENFEPDAKEKTTLQQWRPDTPEALLKIINENQSQWSKALFVYPPGDLRYSELMQWVSPALATYPRIFVFDQEKPQAPDKKE